MIGFVDDTSGSIDNFLQPSQKLLQHYATLAAEDAQRWKNVLHVMGAALNKIKFSYHFLSYEFTLSGIVVAKGDTFDPVIAIKYNSNNNANKIKHLSNYEPNETLGVSKAPTGYNQTGGKVLYEKHLNHAKTIMNSPSDQQDAWTYYHAIYIPSIIYSLPSSTILDKWLTKMQTIIKAALLPKYGFNRNTTSVVVYGSSDFSRIKMRHLVVERGVAQLTHLMMAIHTSAISNKLVMITISWMKLISGISTLVFKDVKSPLPHLAPMKWLPAIQDFLNSQKLLLNIQLDYIPEKQRIKDKFLMDRVINTTCKPSKICKINACRLYKGVTLLSDIVGMEGKTVRKYMIDNNKPLDIHRGLMSYQDCLNRGSWLLWERLLKSFCGDDLTLIQPLGSWLASGDKLHRRWQSCYDNDQNKVFIFKGNEYKIYTVVNNKCYYDGNTTTSITTNALPCRLDYTGEMITIDYSSTYFNNISTAESGDFHTYIRNLPTWENHLLQKVVTTEDIFTAVQGFNKDKATPIYWK